MACSNKKQIEIFTQGDLEGETTVALIKEHVAPNFKVTVHDLSKECSKDYAVEKGVHVCPTIIVSGRVIFCGVPTVKDLFAMGILEHKKLKLPTGD